MYTRKDTKKEWITSEALENKFIKGELSWIWKQGFGIGGTTAMINIEVPYNRADLMAVPTQNIAKDKEAKYRKEIEGLAKHQIKKKIIFLYEGSTPLFDYDEADLIVGVIDSIRYNLDEIVQGHKKQIRYVLIDESHSYTKYSAYRHSTALAIEIIHETLLKHCDDFAMMTLTATPTFYDKDKRVNGYLSVGTPTRLKIYETTNYYNTVKRAREDLKKGLRIAICSNDVKIVRDITKRLKGITFCIKSGGKFSVSLGAVIRNMKEAPETEARVIVISSAGFEGMDLYNTGMRMYFFDDRSSKFNSHLPSNVLQAFHRERKGLAYAEYCRLERTNEREIKITSDQLDEFINDDTPTHKKLSKKFKEITKYIVSDVYECKSHIIKIRGNYPFLALQTEMKLFDDGFMDGNFDWLINYLNIEVIDLKEESKKPKGYKNNSKYVDMVSIVKSNVSYYKNNPLSDRFEFKPNLGNGRSTIDLETLKGKVNVYFAQLEASEIDVTDRQREALKYLDQKEFDKLKKKLTVMQSKYSHKKYGRKKAQERVSSFSQQVEVGLRELIMILIRHNFYIPKKYTAHRDYNVTVLFNIGGLRYFFDLFGINFVEIDIRSAFLRILYGALGLVPPDNIYGENKKNKNSIMIGLNNLIDKIENDKIFLDKNGLRMIVQKQNAKKKLTDLGIDKEVAEMIVNKILDPKDRGALHNYCTYWEKMITTSLKDDLKQLKINYHSDDAYEYLCRRHDSNLVFSCKKDFEFHRTVNNFTFSIDGANSVGGWFHIDNKSEEEPLQTYQNLEMVL